MAARGSFRNPIDRSCFTGCISCHRCEKRSRSECPYPNSCSGRPDREGMRDPHPDDVCRCKEGVLRWVTKDGRLIIRRFGSSPFASKVKTDTESQEDRDWNAFIAEKREALDDEHYDALVFNDGSSVTDWTKKHYGH